MPSSFSQDSHSIEFELTAQSFVNSSQLFSRASQHVNPMSHAAIRRITAHQADFIVC